MIRLLFASTIASLFLAACTGGERQQTGQCPPDEACSPLTLDGMHFTGVPLVGIPLLAEPKTTAIGGTQQIELYKALASGDAVPLDLPFAAVTDNGDALEVAGVGPNSVTLSGLATGSDLLRITEADSDLLYDRYEVAAAVLDHVDLVPSTLEGYEPDAPVAFYQGDLDVGLALYSATGERLADDSLTLSVTGPQPTRTSWDTFSFSGLGPGTLTASLTAAGHAGPIDIEVVDAVDAVLALPTTFQTTIHPGDQGEVCFHATRGAARTVLGLPWQFGATGAVTAVLGLRGNCMALQVNAAGTFTVTGTVLGMSGVQQFTAVTGVAGKPTPAPAAPVGDIRGERARLLDP